MMRSSEFLYILLTTKRSLRLSILKKKNIFFLKSSSCDWDISPVFYNTLQSSAALRWLSSHKRKKKAVYMVRRWCAKGVNSNSFHVLKLQGGTLCIQAGHVIKWKYSFTEDAVTGNNVGQTQKKILPWLPVSNITHSNLNVKCSCCKPCLEQSARVCTDRRTEPYMLWCLYFSLSIPYCSLLEMGC